MVVINNFILQSEILRFNFPKNFQIVLFSLMVVLNDGLSLLAKIYMTTHFGHSNESLRHLGVLRDAINLNLYNVGAF